MKIEYLNEIWKDIKGYEGYYQVSNYGRVRSLDRIVYLYGIIESFRKGKILRLHNFKTGKYYVVTLCNNTERKMFKVHRLVAEAFIPNPLNLPFVNHKDENPLNNRVENLEWCTPEYNSTYNDIHIRRGIKNQNNKVISKPILQYTIDGVFLKLWPSMMEIKRNKGYNPASICNCCKGKHKTAYGFIWKYKD